MVDAEIYVDGNVTTQFHTLNKMVANVDEVAGFQGTPLQKFKPIFRKCFGTKDIKLLGSAEEQLETALNSDLLKPVKSDKKKNKRHD